MIERRFLGINMRQKIGSKVQHLLPLSCSIIIILITYPKLLDQKQGIMPSRADINSLIYADTYMAIVSQQTSKLGMQSLQKNAR